MTKCQTNGADSISVTKGNPAAPLAGTTEPKFGQVYDVKLLGGIVVYVPARD